MRPHEADMESEASVSIISESDGKQASDILPGNKDSEPAIPSLLDCLRAPQKSESTQKLALRKNLSAVDSYRQEATLLVYQPGLSLCQAMYVSSQIKS